MLAIYGKLNKTWIISLEQQNITRTWRDSWQYVIRWHTSHDVKAWLHEHTIWHLTSSICRREWTGAMILLLFFTVFRSRNTFELSPIWWPSRMQSRVTLKLKVTSWSTWPLLSLFVFVLPHSNYRRLRGLHAWPWNWMLRHGLREICHFCLYLCYRNNFVCFVRFLGQRIHSNYCNSRDSYVWSWTQGHVMVYVTFAISGQCMCPTAMIVGFVRFFRSKNLSWLLPLSWPSRVTLTRKVPSWSTCYNN